VLLACYLALPSVGLDLGSIGRRSSLHADRHRFRDGDFSRRARAVDRHQFEAARALGIPRWTQCAGSFCRKSCASSCRPGHVCRGNVKRCRSPPHRRHRYHGGDAPGDLAHQSAVHDDPARLGDLCRDRQPVDGCRSAVRAPLRTQRAGREFDVILDNASLLASATLNTIIVAARRSCCRLRSPCRSR